MKRVVVRRLLKLYLLALSIVSFQFAQAQSDTTCVQGIVVKIDVYNPLHDYETKGRFVFSASLEKFISQHMSIQLTSFFGSAHNEGSYQQIYYVEHLFEVIPEARYYFGPAKQHKGFFAGAYALFERDLAVEYNGVEMNPSIGPNGTLTDNYNFYGAGILCGVQYYFSKDFVFELQFGIGALDTENENTAERYDYLPAYTTGVSLSGFATINLGYKF